MSSKTIKKGAICISSETKESQTNQAKPNPVTEILAILAPFTPKDQNAIIAAVIENVKTRRLTAFEEAREQYEYHGFSMDEFRTILDGAIKSNLGSKM